MQNEKFDKDTQLSVILVLVSVSLNRWMSLMARCVRL